MIPIPAASAVRSPAAPRSANGGSLLATALLPDELPDNNRLRLVTSADIHGIVRRVATQRCPPGGWPLHG